MMPCAQPVGQVAFAPEEEPIRSHGTRLRGQPIERTPTVTATRMGTPASKEVPSSEPKPKEAST